LYSIVLANRALDFNDNSWPLERVKVWATAAVAEVRQETNDTGYEMAMNSGSPAISTCCEKRIDVAAARLLAYAFDVRGLAPTAK